MVQPSVRPPSGAVAVAAWMIQALRESYDVRLLSWEPMDVDLLNRFYGTALHERDVRTHVVPRPIRQVSKLDPDPFSIQPMALLQRVARTIGDRFDVLICPNDEADLGRPGIQYIHYPYLARHWDRERAANGSRLARLRVRARPWRIVSGFDFERMRRNVTLVNSDWTGRVVRERFGIETRTVYPPVAMAEGPAAPRANAFVCLGRMESRKNIPRMVSVVARLRDAGHDVGLTILAGRGRTPDESTVLREIRGLVARCPWVTLRLDVSRAELGSLLRSHRFGIHGKVDEHFGIAVAEMVAAGCIAFVPPGGGQREVVAGDPRLIYDSEEDAVRKIGAVLDSDRLAGDLLTALEPMRAAFRPERFMQEFRASVDELVAANRRLPRD